MVYLQHYKTLLFRCLIAIEIISVIAAYRNGMQFVEDRRRCYTIIPLFRTDCASKCRETFLQGRCLQLHRKWQCLCGTSENVHKLVTPKEAKDMSRICNNQYQSNDACRRLCSKQSFHGYCDELRGIWQCVCLKDENARTTYTWKELNNMNNVCNAEQQDNGGCDDLCPDGFTGSCQNLEGHFACFCEFQESHYRRTNFYYSVSFAESMHEACNSKAHHDAMCQQLCPSNMQFGHCLQDNRIWVCHCRQQYFENELYTLTDASRIYQACYERGYEDRCNLLCPAGMVGAIVELGPETDRKRVCGCKVSLNEREWYTVRKADEMAKVCNFQNHQTDEARQGCARLCPRIFDGEVEGKCEYREGFYECFCKSLNSENNWITLKDAIAIELRNTYGNINV